MDREVMKKRFKDFALRIIKLVQALPKTREGYVIGNQIMKSGTSGPANYHSSCRAKSKNDFIAKLGIVEEEMDETCFWLELIIESKIISEELLKPLLKESNELLAITISSKITAKKNSKIENRKSQIPNA